MSKKFNPKDFLNAEILSPLEQNKIRGGFADSSIGLDDNVVVQQVVRREVVQRVVVRRIG